MTAYQADNVPFAACAWIRIFNGCLVALWIVILAPVSSSAAERPNFVIVMVDDMGFGDAGCYGGTEFPTPHIDRLAAEGLRFTDFHSSGCVCSPTRAGLLTGRYQQRAGVDGVIYAAFHRNRNHGLQRNETTFAEVLSAAGYATAIIGKWHLGYEEQYNPIHHGFHQFVGYVSGNVDFHSHIDGAGVFDWWHRNEPNRETGYTTHLITQHACEFIEAQAKTDQPFCLYVAHEAPHDPYQGPHDKPVREEGVSTLLWNHREPEHAKRAYREMMLEMDRGVGELLVTLEQTGIDRQTVVLFFSDNGATGPGSTGGFSGMKGTLWEGGHRVPGIVRWPGRIRAGELTDQLAITIDMMPTLLDIAAIDRPPGLSFDGISLVPVLLNNATIDDRQVFWKYGDASCMRDGSWKLILNGGPHQRRDVKRRSGLDAVDGDLSRGKIALMDLSTDLREERNLAAEHPERVQHMMRALSDWQIDVTTSATAQPETEKPSQGKQ